jgi:hypothetical protein
MKKYVFACFLVICCFSATAQFNLEQFNKERSQLTKNGMLVLGSWSVANIITGGIGLSNNSGEAEYFHRMNLIWGSVNLVIAGASYLSLTHRKADLSFGDTRKEQSRIEKTFLLNGTLDLVYITAGFYLCEKGNSNSNPNKYKGFGKSVIMQGAGLLLFDGIMYVLHVNHGKRFWKVLDGLQLAPNALGLNIRL